LYEISGLCIDDVDHSTVIDHDKGVITHESHALGHVAKWRIVHLVKNIVGHSGSIVIKKGKTRIAGCEATLVDNVEPFT
jgi:hypothetical protein